MLTMLEEIESHEAQQRGHVRALVECELPKGQDEKVGQYCPLNPEDGKELVTAYIDDILVFSPTLPEHTEHLQKVISCLKEVNLKLNPAKCKFVRKEVDYLGHVITTGGLKPMLPFCH